MSQLVVTGQRDIERSKRNRGRVGEKDQGEGGRSGVVHCKGSKRREVCRTHPSNGFGPFTR